MATDITGLTMKLGLLLQAEPVKTADFASMRAPVTLAKSLEFAFGSSAGQCDQMWWDRRTLAGSADDDIDLAGVLKNAFGTVVTFSEIRLIVVINRSDEAIGAHIVTSAVVSIGPAPANGWLGPFHAAGDRLDIVPGNPFLLADFNGAPWSVSAGDGDILRLTEELGVEALYDILIAGTSA